MSLQRVLSEALYPRNRPERDPRAPRGPLLGQLTLPKRRSKPLRCCDEGSSSRLSRRLGAPRPPPSPRRSRVGHKLDRHAPQ